MAKGSVGVLNVDQLIHKLNNIATVDLTKALNRACLIVEGEAKINVTSQVKNSSGTLRNSITHEVEGNKGVIGTNVPYAPYVEIGTGIFSGDDLYVAEYKGKGRQTPWVWYSEEGYTDKNGNEAHFVRTKGQSPKPFLTPALIDNQDRIRTEIGKEIQTKVNEICLK